MQQLSGSGGLSRPRSARARPRIRGLGPERGAEKRIRLSGALEEEVVVSVLDGCDGVEEALEGLGVRVLAARAGAGLERRSV